jgi:tetratricopeptide (TPR) repeat protein
MTKKIIGCMIVGLMTVCPAIPARAFQGDGQGGVGPGAQGGFGFTGSPGGGFTGPRGGGFTDSLGGFRSANDSNGYSFLNAFRNRGSVAAQRTRNGGGTGSRLNSANLWSGFHSAAGGNRSGSVNRLYRVDALSHYGYSSYGNPYVVGASAGHTTGARPTADDDYSQPIPAQCTPTLAAAEQAVFAFDAARQAFKVGDYSRALEWVGQALRSRPDAPSLHEFRALAFFALKRYDQAAPALYAVMSVRPGWDWTTLISLYANPETYTQQVRALEAFKTHNPRSAPARFVLAYHYLTGEHADAAVQQLKFAIALEPRDAVSAQLVPQLDQPRQRAAATGPGVNEGAIPPAGGAEPAAHMAPTGKPGKIEGAWTAQPSHDRHVIVIFYPGGRFAWKVIEQGKDRQFRGQSVSANGVLTLVQDQTMNELTGSLSWMDGDHFVLKALGAGPGEPGLSFTKRSGVPGG